MSYRKGRKVVTTTEGEEILILSIARALPFILAQFIVANAIPRQHLAGCAKGPNPLLQVGALLSQRNVFLLGVLRRASGWCLLLVP